MTGWLGWMVDTKPCWCGLPGALLTSRGCGATRKRWRPQVGSETDCMGRGVSVPYVITEPCIDVKDKSCIEECPVDCIYEGDRMLYIHPDECVDCGACEP